MFHDGLAYNPLILANYNLAVQKGSFQYLQFGLMSYTQMNHMSIISNLNVLASVEGLAGTRVVPEPVEVWGMASLSPCDNK